MTESTSESIEALPQYSDLFIRLLQQVCQTTPWEYGEVWLPKIDGSVLELSSAWYVDTQLNSSRQLAWKQFRYCSEKFVLRIGEGLPGRVWASQTPEWIRDVSVQSEAYFLRNQIAKAFGAKASFGLPINTKDIQAILAFFRSEAQAQNMQTIAATATIVRQANFKH